MCPACLTTAASAVAGVTSAGGLTTLGVKKLRTKTRPIFTFNEAISFQVSCESQEEVDYYWGKLSEGGDEKAQQCGWLKDKYVVSWQIVPTVLVEMLQDKDARKSQRVMKALLQMKKLDGHQIFTASLWATIIPKGKTISCNQGGEKSWLHQFQMGTTQSQRASRSKIRGKRSNFTKKLLARK